MTSSLESSEVPRADDVAHATLLRQRGRIRAVFETITPYGSIVVLIALTAYYAERYSSIFWTASNIKQLLAGTAPLAIVAGGLTVALISLDFDLSIGALITLSGLTTALLLQKHVALVPTVAIVLALGVVTGLANGIVVLRLGVSAFIATLAAQWILDGLGTWWSGGGSVNVADAGFTSWGTSSVAGIPIPVVVMGVFYIILWVALERTTLGRKVYAVGANEEAARLGGIPAVKVRLAAFVLCSVSAAVAGLLLTSQLDSAQPGVGDPLLLQAFAAAFLGAVTIRLGHFNVLGTAVGVLILAVLSNGAAIAGTQGYVVDLIQGGILIAAVAIAGASGTLKRRGR